MFDMRVLGRIRLSRLTDESTSATRQREIIERWAKDNDHTVVGWAEDLDVSGGIDPFDTPALGPWLTQKLDQWDILCAWKLDRLARRAVPLHRLFGLCQDHQKTLVCVSDNLDLSHWVGRLVASVIAGVAEGELEAIRERTKASQRKLRELGRWPGGRPAYGYMAVPRQDSAGWELQHDPVTAPVLRQIVERVLDGQSVESIARDLAGTLTPSDVVRVRNGQQPKGAPWRAQTIRQLLRSKTMLGYVTHQGVTQRDTLGNPISKGPALVSGSEFDRIQHILESRSFKKTRSVGTSPLLGVALCYNCDTPLHHRGQTTNGKLYRYYYCRPCKGASIHAEMVEELLEETFLEAVGDQNVLERVFRQAENHQIELDEALRAVEELSLLLGTITSDSVRSTLTEQMKALDFRISALEKLPAREAGWEWKETGQNFTDAWNMSNTLQRRQLLLKSGITFRIKRIAGTQAVKSQLYIPDEILDLLNTKNPPYPN